MPEGKIVRIISNQFTVLTASGEKLVAVMRGKLKRSDYPVVGDQVNYVLSGGQCVIESIHPRRNLLNRPVISNVDLALIVMSVKEPDFSYQLVDRLIFLVALKQITPVILLTKTDLATAQETEAIQKEYSTSGYTVLTNRDGPERFHEVLTGKTAVLCGQSGVGKSTLLNMLDASFALPTQSISKALNRGKHTTRHTELYAVAGGWIADTPGFSSLDFSRVSSFELAKSVPDFQRTGSCRFLDCRHIKEPGCAIKQGVEEGTISRIRYDDYIQAIALCDVVEEWKK